MNIYIDNDIISEENSSIYEYLEIPHTSPKQIKSMLDNIDENEDIILNINSGGGNLYAGAEIYTLLKNAKNKIEVIITGVAGSSASVIAMAGDTIKMSPIAMLMIHNASGATHGDYREQEQLANYLKKVNENIANTYKQRTKLPQEQLLDMMNKETWLKPDEALKYGFVDEILFNDDTVQNNINCGTLNNKTINKVKNLILKDKMQDKEPAQDEEEVKDNVKLKRDVLLAKINITKLKEII